jgi:hypothetical protein
MKGHSSQSRLSPAASGQHFTTVVKTDPINRAGQDTLPKTLFEIDGVSETAEALLATDAQGLVDKELKVIKLTGHAVRVGDVLRFDTGTNIHMEVPVEKVETNLIYIGGLLLGAAATDTFIHNRYITLKSNSTGAAISTPGPLEFVLDGATTQVIEDTVTPSNNVPLPVKLTSVTGDINITAGDLNVQLTATGATPDSTRIGDGTNELGINASLEALTHDADALTELQAILAKIIASPATEAKQDTAITALGDILAKIIAAPATEAKQDTAITALGTLGTEVTSAAILAKIIAAPATEAKQDAIITALGTSNAVKHVIDSAYTAAPTIPTATRLTTGVAVPASKLGTELEIFTKAGDNFTAYDASSGGNVLGRFTQAGNKISVNLVTTTPIFLQSDTGSDFVASDLTINLIGVDV